MFFEPSMKIVMKAICGRDEEWVKQSLKNLVGKATRLHGKSWLRDDIDMVDITAPSNVHKEIAIAAAEGKHIFAKAFGS